MTSRKKNDPVGEPPAHRATAKPRELPPATTELNDGQRRKFLDALRADNTIGLVAALRHAGASGTKLELRSLIDDDLADQAREARGWNINRVEGVAWQVATDPKHPAWDRANARILKAYHPAFRDRAEVDVNHSGSVDTPDVAAAIDRFTTLTAAAIRAASRDAEGDTPQLTE